MTVRTLAGVDGCRAGWVAAVRNAGADRPHRAVFADFATLIAALGDDAIIAVDMPIGLPKHVGAGGRAPEPLVRPFLGARQSSVFSIPARAAVYAETYGAACAAALAASDPPRKVSRQAFNLFPKIREIDILLRDRPGSADRVIESHPEVAFWKLNGERAMAMPKKIKGRVNPAGMAERRTLLSRRGLDHAFVDMALETGVAADDWLDACALLLVAARHAGGQTTSFPDPPQTDAYGLPIAIWC